MSTLQETSHRPEEQGHKTRPWMWIAIAVVAVLAIAGIAWIVVSDGTSDIDTATELANTWAQGWEENDPEAVGSVLTDDGIYINFGEVVRNKEETMQDVRNRGARVTEADPVTDLTETDDGTFTYVAEYTVDGTDRFSAIIEIELDGDFVSRLEWLSMEEITDS